MRQKPERIAYWDGLRGLAAVLVVIHHMMIGFYPSTYTVSSDSIHTGTTIEYVSHNTPLGIVINGGFAVAIFLVLSGYMVGLFSDKKTSLIRVIGNIIKRFFRFFAPILATHLITLAILSTGWYWNQQAAAITGSHWWLGQMWQMDPSVIESVRQAFLSLFKMYPLTQVYNSSTWTMPFFFLGPLGLLLGLFFLKQERLRNGVLVIAMILLLKTHYWPIIAGYLLSKITSQVTVRSNRLVQIILVLIVVVLGNYPQAYDTADNSWLYGGLPVVNFAHTSTFYHTLATLALMVLISFSTMMQRLLSSKPLLFLGKISFSLYLLHVLVINSVTSGTFMFFSERLSYSAAFGLSQLLSIPLIVFGSMLLYRFIELPAMAASRSVLQWSIWLFQDMGKRLKRN